MPSTPTLTTSRGCSLKVVFATPARRTVSRLNQSIPLVGLLCQCGYAPRTDEGIGTNTKNGYEFIALRRQKVAIYPFSTVSRQSSAP